MIVLRSVLYNILFYINLVVLLLLSNVVQNAVIGPDNSVFGGVLGALTLVGVNELVVRASNRSPRFRAMLAGRRARIITNGRLDAASGTRHTLGGYGRVDLAARWQFAPHWSLGLRAENVFDKDYETAYGYASGGRAAFACVPPATHVTGVDHQSVMLERFTETAVRRGVTSETFLGDWPDVAQQVPIADVVTCHHVFYNVQDLQPFVHALTAHAHNRVVVELPMMHPLSDLNSWWLHFWNLERPTAPTALDAAQCVRALGYDVQALVWEEG